jgi:hypothetical protein
VSTAAESRPALQREWWRRTFAVFQRPGAVFAGLRDDSQEGAEARGEPLTAIVILAGIAGVLSTSLAGRLLDQPEFDGVDVAVWAFLGGAVQGLVGFWVGGLLLLFGIRVLDGPSTFRQARHIVGFAAAPVALSLVLVWPVRLAVYGRDLFRAGGGDRGTGDLFFEGLVVAVFAWMLVLVIVGVRSLTGWSWARAAAAFGIAAVLPVLIVLVSLL